MLRGLHVAPHWKDDRGVTDAKANVDGVDRYQKQVRLVEMGEGAQRALAESHAVVVGVGALGCAAGDLLARAGVGKLTLVDRDVVEWSNLQRQTLYTEVDAREGVPKAEAARRRLHSVNSSIEIEAKVADVTARNAESVLLPTGEARAERLVLVDGSDNFELRFLLNDVAVKYGVPLAYAGVVGMVGTAMMVVPGKTACLRCVGEKPTAGTVETCETAGVFGPAVAAIAAVQAAEVIRVLAMGRESIASSLVSVDVWRRATRTLSMDRPSEGCVCCGARRFAYLEARGLVEEATLCGQDAVQVSVGGERRVDLAALARGWRGLGQVTCSALLARLAFAGEARAREITVFADGRAIVKGTTRAEVARAIYARYVGM